MGVQEMNKNENLIFLDLAILKDWLNKLVPVPGFHHLRQRSEVQFVIFQETFEKKCI